MATEMEKVVVAQPKAGIFRNFVRSIRKNFWIDPSVVIEKDRSNATNRKAVYKLMDRHGFDYRVWAVASSGFFTDSYNLFAANVIIVMLNYIYWPDATGSTQELKINVPTLFGSLVGMLIFGVLSDIYGRRKLYGLELIVVIFGTLGIVAASTGYDGSMDIMGWLITWRFFMGMGIGAEYPLSAVLTAEFAPRKSRAKMMAAVFLMQSLGQLAAALVGLAAVLALGAQHGLINLDKNDQTSKRWVDSIWRIVIGVGAFPALVAIVFRLTIPESPRFTLDIDNDDTRALEDITEHYHGHPYAEIAGDTKAKEASASSNAAGALLGGENSAAATNHEGVEEEGEEEEDEEGEEEKKKRDERPKPFSQADLRDYFITKGSWRFLAATSTCWFLLDFAFYGLGINNPRQIARVWASTPPNATLSEWETVDPNANIYHVLRLDAIQSIYTISIGSVVGSLVLIKLIDYFPRKAILIVSFIILAVLFFLIGGTLFAVEYTNQHALTIVLYSLCQFFFNLGPNPLTFIISAEIFPTRYRGTCHGFSAASGKLGSIAVQLLLARSDVSLWKPVHLGIILLIFGVFMGFGALIAWVWLPDVQYPRDAIKTSASPEDGNALPSTDAGEANHTDNEASQGGQEAAAAGESQAAESAEKNQDKEDGWLDKYIVPSKSLEELAKGWKAMTDGPNGQVLSLRRNLGIYDVTLPFVKMVQKWVSKKKDGKEKEKEEALNHN